MNERQTSIKGLPLTELSITAVASICDVYEDEETGKQLPVVEMEVLNQEDWDKFNAPKHEANRCAICGHGLKISCAVTHKPTGNGYYIGRDCASKITELQKFGALIKGATVALAQRIACDKREADFIAANPDAIGVITWSKRPNAPRISRDICEKLRRFGSISVKQIELLEKIRQQDIDRRAKATGTATNGRQAIKGTVMKVSASPNEFKRSRYTGHAPMVTKLVIDLGNGVRLMGNAPENTIIDALTLPRTTEGSEAWKQGYRAEVGSEVETHLVVRKGDVVELKATVEQSQKDNLFGFWKRPTAFKVVALAPEVAAPLTQ